MRAVFEVTGTTVMTPRRSRAAVALAASLPTTTAGRGFAGFRSVLVMPAHVRR
jgi:hypothetical protein